MTATLSAKRGNPVLIIRVIIGAPQRVNMAPDGMIHTGLSTIGKIASLVKQRGRALNVVVIH